MRLSPFCLAAALASAVTPRPGAAQVPADIVVVLDNVSRPALALDPTTGAPHIAYVSGGTLSHAFKSGGSWQTEPVASGLSFPGEPSPFYGFDLRVAPEGRAIAVYVRSGTLECAVRESGGWQRDSLDTMPNPSYPVALTVSPVTGEPSVAWARAPSSPGLPVEIKLARRSGGVWTGQVLDTVSTTRLAVGVAVDFADRPSVAWGRPRADTGPGVVLTCATAAGPSGPFIAVPVDSELSTCLSMAVDPATGDPRIAYNAVAGNGSKSVRYADRLGDGSWEVTLVLQSTGLSTPALALDAGGNPFIANTVYSFIEPAGLHEPGPTRAHGCFFTTTGDVCLFYRAGGAGTGPFQLAGCLGADQLDSANGPRAVDSRTLGVADVAWRSPGFNCAPFAISYGKGTPFAGVGSGPGTRVALGPIAPNPARWGATLRVTFDLADAAAVAVELQDLAGRRVDRRAAERLGAGLHAIAWVPATTRAGVYWLTVRTDGRRLGSRSLVIVR